MEFCIEGKLLKVFGRACQILGKVADYTILECSKEKGLYLRTLNTTRSAYVIFKFYPTFFSNILCGDDTVLKNRICIKSLLLIFKNVKIMDKSVESGTIRLDKDSNIFTFIASYSYGAVRNFELCLDDNESIQYDVSKENLNYFAMSPRIVDQFVNQFSALCDEVSLSITNDHLKLKNYVLPETESSKLVRTEITLTPEEFEFFEFKNEGSITFCLKDFRIFASFILTFGLTLHFRFEDAGKPVIISALGSLYDVDMVLSTVVVNGIENYLPLEPLVSRTSRNTSYIQREKSILINDSNVTDSFNLEDSVRNIQQEINCENDSNNNINLENVLEKPTSVVESSRVFSSSIITASQKRKYLKEKLFSQLDDSHASLISTVTNKQSVILAEDSDPE